MNPDSHHLIELHRDRFHTHMLDLFVSLIVGLTIGGLATYMWLQDTRAVRFEVNPQNSLIRSEKATPQSSEESI